MNISVFITSYNQKAFLVEAIESVLAQTLSPSQILVVDDCSSDGSQEVIEGYRSRYPDLITAIFHTQNRGVAQARAHALQAISGDYVTYVDGDDRFLPQKLEKEAALLARRREIQIAFSNNYYMTETGQRTGIWITNKWPPQGDVFKETLTRQFPRGNLFRMELLPYAAWQAVGFHDPNLSVLEDWDMRIRLSKCYRVAYWDEPLTEIRVHNRGLSSVSTMDKLVAFDHIWDKNKPLLEDLSLEAQGEIAGEMDRLRAEFMRQQAKEALGAYARPYQGSRAQAWTYYRESWRYHRRLDLDLLLGLVLPSSAYGRFRQYLRFRLGRIGADSHG
jgi:glycosyltransferase involved in cell wall biosynthesis